MDSFSKIPTSSEVLGVIESMTQCGRGSKLRAVLLGSVLLALAFSPNSGFAVGQINFAQASTQDARPKRDVPTMTSETYEKLANFAEILIPTDDEGNRLPEELIGERDLPAAKEILDDFLIENRGLNGNELAQVHRNYAWLAQEMDDMQLSIEHLTKILDYREEIAYVLEEQTLYNLSKLHFTLEEYDQALVFALQYLDLSISDGPSDFAWIAQVYFALEDYENTKTWISLAISNAEEKLLPVKEVWREMLVAVEDQLSKSKNR